jgi:hypothetical protein
LENFLAAAAASEIVGHVTTARGWTADASARAARRRLPRTEGLTRRRHFRSESALPERPVLPAVRPTGWLPSLPAQDVGPSARHEKSLATSFLTVLDAEKSMKVMGPNPQSCKIFCRVQF